jgi:DNA-directed RNA polymerase specialized sigma24 family protein
MQLQNFIEPEGEFDYKPPDRLHNKKKEEETASTESGDDEPRLYASTGAVIDALEEAFRNDKNLLIKLRFKALYWIRWYFFGDMIGNQTNEDVVNEVIAKVVNGDRKWFPEKTPNIVHLLLMTIVSHIRNELNKTNRQKHNDSTMDLYDKDGNLNEHNIAEVQRGYVLDYLQVEENKEALESRIERLFKDLEDDYMAYFVLDEILKINHDDEKKSLSSIAIKLNISESEVRNAFRRIVRKYKKIIS